MKYSLAAVMVAVVIIAASLFANPMMPNQTSASGSFLVMLTDPPTVPAGTTLLNLSYSDISLHVTYMNGTAEWLPVGAPGTVNLFSLINMSQTLASTTIPVGSRVDKVQFAIDDVVTVVNGTAYNVTALSNTLVVSVVNSLVNQTLSGVLVDFNPTLVQIQATDANGAIVYYYVLVPSARAVIVDDLNREHIRVGTIVKLGENTKVRLLRVEEEFSKNVTIVSASLSVAGNATSLSVTLKNGGNASVRVFGLTVHGEFNVTRTGDTHGNKNGKGVFENIHPRTIPFKLNGTSLIPLFGTEQKHDGEHEHDNESSDDTNEDTVFSSLVLQPGENITLSFSGIISLQPERDDQKNPATVLTPVVGDNYTLRLMGEGFQIHNIVATS